MTGKEGKEVGREGEEGRVQRSQYNNIEQRDFKTKQNFYYGLRGSLFNDKRNNTQGKYTLNL